MSQIDLSSSAGEPSHHERLTGVIDAIGRGVAVPVASLASDNGVSLRSLLGARGFARVRVGREWVTSDAESHRVRRILRPAQRGSLFDIEHAATDAVDAVLNRAVAGARPREVD